MCTRASAGTDCAEASGAVQQTKPRQQLDESKGRIATGDRIRDRNGFRRRAAAFCARIALSATTTEGGTGGGDVDTVQRRWPPNLGALEVLMVSGRTAADGYWVLPGGGVENMESTEEAVVRELREEAGILGKVLFCIGEFVDDQRFHHTTLFFLTVREVFTEWGENCENGRQRRWMNMEQARHSIKHNQRDMLERSIKIIERTLGEQLEPAVSKCLSEKPVVSLRATEDTIQQQQKQHRQKDIDTTSTTATTVPATIITGSAVVATSAIDGVTSAPFGGGHVAASATNEAGVGHHRQHQTVVTTAAAAPLANGMVEAEDAAALLNVMMMTNGNGNSGGGGDGRNNSAIQ